jgi:hypothetical protein
MHARRLFSRSWSETCDVVWGSRFVTFIIATLITAFAAYLPWLLGRQSANAMTQAFISLGYAVAANAAVFLCIFVAHFLYLTPKRLLLDAELKQDNALTALDNERDTKAARERLSKQIQTMSDLWSEGKRVLANLQNPDLDFDTVKAEASNWFGRVTDWLETGWGKAGDANYFRDCDDGADAIPDVFHYHFQKERNRLCRGIQQRVRNLRVILDREIAKRP